MDAQIKQLIDAPCGIEMPNWEVTRTKPFQDLVDSDLAMFNLTTFPTGILKFKYQISLFLITEAGKIGVDRELLVDMLRMEGSMSPLNDIRSMIELDMVETVQSDKLRFRVK